MEPDFLTFLCEFMQNETLQKDFEAYNKAVDDLIEREGISENEALARVMETWDMSAARKEFGL